MAGDKAGGLFGPPRRATRWVEARVEGRDVPAGPVDPDAAYVSLDLVDLRLSRPGFLTSKFHPLFLSDLTVATQMQTKLRQSALIDPRKVQGGIETKNASGVDPATSSICAQMPWQGKMDGELVVLALRDEGMLKALLSVNEKLADALNGEPEVPEVPGAADDDAGHESVLVATVAAKVASKFLKKIGYTAAVEVARILQAQDGTYQTRLRVPLDLPVMKAGYFVMLPADKAGDAVLDFSGGKLVPELRVDGRKLNGRDYAVIRVKASAKHEDIEDVPAVGEAWMTLQRVLEAGGQPDPALNAFRRVVAISPYLIAPDRKRLQDTAAELVALARPLIAAPDGQESVASAQLLRFAFRTLKDVWDSGVLKPGADAAAKPGAPEPEAPKAQPKPAPPVAPPAATTETPISRANRFETALKFCFRWEGDYSDHAADRGGKTKYGVTEKVYHEWLDSRGEEMKPVSGISKDQARAIYWSEYWLAARCDRMLSQLDLVMFDAAVNHGPGGAASLLQRALKSLGEAVKVDGAIGSQTLTAAGRHKPDAVCTQYLTERRALYQRIVDKDKSQEVFLKGWMNRVADLERAIAGGGSASGLESLGAPEREPVQFAEYIE